mgnify:CR=1 FL=1
MVLMAFRVQVSVFYLFLRSLLDVCDLNVKMEGLAGERMVQVERHGLVGDAGHGREANAVIGLELDPRAQLHL